jgi:hypothetical protein
MASLKFLGNIRNTNVNKQHHLESEYHRKGSTANLPHGLEIWISGDKRTQLPLCVLDWQCRKHLPVTILRNARTMFIISRREAKHRRLTDQMLGKRQ